MYALRVRRRLEGGLERVLVGRCALAWVGPSLALWRPIRLEANREGLGRVTVLRLGVMWL